VTEDRDIGLPARRAAIDILASALGRRAGLDEALTRPAFRNLEPRDRGFAMALAMAALSAQVPDDVGDLGRHA